MFRQVGPSCSNAARNILLIALAGAAFLAVWVHRFSLIRVGGDVWIRALPHLEEFYYFMLARIEVSMWGVIVPILLILVYMAGILVGKIFHRAHFMHHVPRTLH